MAGFYVPHIRSATNPPKSLTIHLVRLRAR
jgi:hypothetical protein